MSARRLRAAVVAALAAAGLLVLPSGGGASGREVSIRNGEIAFVRNANVYGEGFLHTVTADGSRVRKVLKSGWVRSAAWSPDGKRLALVDKCAIKIRPASGGRLRTIVKPPKRDTFQGWSDCFSDLDWSPDGRRLAFTLCMLFCDGPTLYIVESSGRGFRQLTQRDCVSGRLRSCPGLGDLEPDWSPNGESVLFARQDSSLPDPAYSNLVRNNKWRIYRVSPDGTGLALVADVRARAPVVSPDGTRIAFIRFVGTAPPPTAEWTGSVGVMNADGTGEKTLVQQDQGGNREPSDCRSSGWSVEWSPDGTKLAFSGICPGGIYVLDPDTGERVRVTGGADFLVSWRSLP